MLDLGTETYDKTTFSGDRYTKYCQNGHSHNALVFNGIPQQYGEGGAREFKVTGDENAFVCTMEISACYPEEVGLLSYVRTFAWQDNVFTVHDKWKAKAPLKATMTLLSEVPGLGYETNMDSHTEPMHIADQWLKARWGDTVFRSILTLPEAKSDGDIYVKIKMD